MRKRFLQVKYGAALAVFAVSVAGVGYLLGTRKEQNVMPTPTALLATTDAFTSPVARALSPADYETLLQKYRRDATGARSNAEAFQAADKLHDLGRSAHYRDVGRGTLALSAFSAALTVYKRDRSPAHTGETVGTLCDYAEALLLQGRTQEAKSAFHEALLRSESRGRDGLYANTAFEYGNFLISVGAYDAGRKQLLASRAVRVSLEPAGVAQCEWMLGVADSDQGRYDAATRHLTDAAVRFTQKGDRESCAAVWGSLGDVAFRRGDFAAADDYYNRGLSRWREIGQSFWTGVFLARRARVRLALGDLSGAQSLADESLDVLAESNGAMARATALQVLGEAATRTGDYRDADDYLRESLSLREQRGSVRGAMEAHEALAYLHDATGDTIAKRREENAAQNLRNVYGVR